MLGLDNPIHIAFLFVLLLLVFGAKRLPELGRSLGAGLRGFKDSISGESPAGQLDLASVAAPVEARPAAPGEARPAAPVEARPATTTVASPERTAA